MAAGILDGYQAPVPIGDPAFGLIGKYEWLVLVKGSFAGAADPPENGLVFSIGIQNKMVFADHFLRFHFTCLCVSRIDPREVELRVQKNQHHIRALGDAFQQALFAAERVFALLAPGDFQSVNAKASRFREKNQRLMVPLVADRHLPFGRILTALENGSAYGAPVA